MQKRHLAFSEASGRRNHSEVPYLNLFEKTTTCIVAKPLVWMIGLDKNIIYRTTQIFRQLSKIYRDFTESKDIVKFQGEIKIFYVGEVENV